MNSTDTETAGRPGRLEGPAGVLVLVLTAAVARLLYFFQARNLLLFNEATGDAAQYLTLAGAVRAQGLWAPLGEPYFQAPFYPWYLALTAGDGAGLLLPRLLQFGAGILGVLIVRDTTARIAGGRAGFWAGLFAALYAPAIFFEGELLSITWALLFLHLATREIVLLKSGGDRVHALLAGAAFALSGLAQPNVLLVPAVVAAVLAAAALRPGDRSARSALGLFAVGLVVVLAPVTVRNHAQTGEWILVSSNGGINFFIGNNPEADGSFSLPAAEPLLNRSDGLSMSSMEAASRALGTPAGPSAASGYWFRRGFAAWGADPLQQFGLLARKMLLFLSGTELPNHYDIRYFQARVPILRLLPGFFLLMPLAVWGALTLRKSSEGRLLLVVGAAYAASVILFFVTDRYRLPVIAVMLPLAGNGLAVLIETARRREPGRMLAGSLVMIAFLFLGAFPLMDTSPALAHMHNLAGTLYYQRSELGAARQEFERAVAISPASADALNNLGRVALLQKNTREAEDHFRRAITADPRLPEAWFNLEELQRNLGLPGDALATIARLEENVPGARTGWAGAIDYRKGLNHLAMGDTLAARTAFEGAVRLKPDLAAAWAGLGSIDGSQGRLNDSARHFAEAIRHAPDYFSHHFNAGVVAEKLGDYPAALNAYNRALELAPDTPEARARILTSIARVKSPEGRQVTHD